MTRTSQQITDDLRQPLEVSRVKKRDGAGSMKLSYLEAYDVIDTLNRVFGFDGWSSSVKGIEAIPGAKMVRATVEIMARIGDRTVTHSGVGIGVHRSEKQDEIEKAYKEAESDALKRAARHFGAQFGNELYDKLAPEHSGQQRPALASQEALQEYAGLRTRAIAKGFTTPKGNPPLILNSETPAHECEARAKALRNWLAENDLGPQPAELPEEFERAAIQSEASETDESIREVMAT